MIFILFYKWQWGTGYEIALLSQATAQAEKICCRCKLMHMQVRQDVLAQFLNLRGSRLQIAKTFKKSLSHFDSGCILVLLSLWLRTRMDKSSFSYAAPTLEP